MSLPPLPKVAAPLAMLCAVVLAALGSIDGAEAVAVITLTLGYAFGVATPTPGPDAAPRASGPDTPPGARP